MRTTSTMTDDRTTHDETPARRKPPDRRAPREARAVAHAGQRVPERLPSRRPRRRPAGGVRRCGEVDRRSARSVAAPRETRRPHARQARDGQGGVRAGAGRQRAHPAVPAVEHARRNLRRLQGLGRRRHPRGRRHADAHQDRRVVGQGRCAAPAHQVAAPAAGQVARPGGCRAALSPALRRPDRDARGARCVRQAFAGHRRDPPLARRAPLPRSGNADDALHRRRRDREAVHHAPQRAGPGPVPARGAGAVSQAPGRRRFRARVRDQPQLPQRRRQHAAQPGVHDARVVRGLRHVRRGHGPDRGHDPPRRAGSHRHDRADVGRQRDRPGPALPSLEARRSRARTQPGDHRRRLPRPRSARASLRAFAHSREEG